MESANQSIGGLPPVTVDLSQRGMPEMLGETRGRPGSSCRGEIGRAGTLVSAAAAAYPRTHDVDPGPDLRRERPGCWRRQPRSHNRNRVVVPLEESVRHRDLAREEARAHPITADSG